MTNEPPLRILRARIAHTPASPFGRADALQTWEDGALAIDDRRIVAIGSYRALRRRFPQAGVIDHRPGLLLPGFVDTHAHYPQVRIVGAMGSRLLEWLQDVTLPEEARFADTAYAREAARTFVNLLVRNGTTTALVFGAHFAAAQEALFAEAVSHGLTLISGLTLADEGLIPALLLPPKQARAESARLIETWHGRGRIRYAVTPRFALSASPALLDVCGELVRSRPGIVLQTHINETQAEIDAVRARFPSAASYLDVYDRAGLVGRRSILAHNLHPQETELDRLAAAGATVAHCPTSNAFLGSGLFPMRRHVERGVRVALGSDIGAGTSFSLLRQAGAAYETQMLRPDGFAVSPAQLLYLTTRAGAEALDLADECGDLTPGKRADLVVLRPPAGSTLEAVTRTADSVERLLAAYFILGDESSVESVYLGGRGLFRA